MLKVLTACEFSGAVRDEMTRAGHLAVSCDLEPTDTLGFHFQDDVRKLDVREFDLMIAFPPCTYLTVSGNAWRGKTRERVQAEKDAVDFFMWFVNAPVKYKAIENPIGVMSSRYRKPDQIVHPWHFGHGESKATCFWLFNLPPLTPTNIVDGRRQKILEYAPGPMRQKLRSKTYPGVAAAMVQWANYIVGEPCA